ncbi:hypothetical protein EIN_173210 [Entamoeba invadens IP1]|uniref:Proteinase inhibitor I42 chagasin domain-containing protein n=1 Tax=Entamoeba invadens IP1 TaxID=370355 RepID=A0A0A1TW16_ENTIV|nr:hypothetical protein EIN_173210 [Entamoeba invadens IP1]ELP84656.1 hypothetical protein EIN_173210 [Entamoeba invadens IP1]|eukprot:XP_004184002.1 hypothetical protein EIN_173210 [Entamoeba invadens IP1]
MGVIVFVALLTISWAETYKITLENNGQLFNFKNGEEFDVVLVTNPSTGHNWELETNNRHLQLLDHKITENKENIPGSNFDEVWSFRAIKKGFVWVNATYNIPTTKDIDYYFTVVIRVM